MRCMSMELTGAEWEMMQASVHLGSVVATFVHLFEVFKEMRGFLD